MSCLGPNRATLANPGLDGTARESQSCVKIKDTRLDYSYTVLDIGVSRSIIRCQRNKAEPPVDWWATPLKQLEIDSGGWLFRENPAENARRTLFMDHMRPHFSMPNRRHHRAPTFPTLSIDHVHGLHLVDGEYLGAPITASQRRARMYPGIFIASGKRSVL